MKGTNDLLLNQATMIEAVQFWLDSQMVNPVPKVMNVKVENPNQIQVTFTVSLNSEADRSKTGDQAP